MFNPYQSLHILDPLSPFALSVSKGSFDPSSFVVATGVSFGADKFDHPVVFFPNEWTMRYFTEKNPKFKLLELPPEQAN